MQISRLYRFFKNQIGFTTFFENGCYDALTFPGTVDDKYAEENLSADELDIYIYEIPLLRLELLYGYVYSVPIPDIFDIHSEQKANAFSSELRKSFCKGLEFACKNNNIGFEYKKLKNRLDDFEEDFLDYLKGLGNKDGYQEGDSYVDNISEYFITRLRDKFDINCHSGDDRKKKHKAIKKLVSLDTKGLSRYFKKIYNGVKIISY